MVKPSRKSLPLVQDSAGIFLIMTLIPVLMHRLEHSVVVMGLGRDPLQNIPMLDDLTLFEAENIHSGLVRVAGPFLAGM